MNESAFKTKGQLAIRALAMPAHTNPSGDIFGGWVVSQMDLAGLSIAQSYCDAKIVTVAIDTMKFISPVKVGDFICCYADVVRKGRTSITINIETWAVGPKNSNRRQVTEGEFVYVAVSPEGKPTPLDR